MKKEEVKKSEVKKEASPKKEEKKEAPKENKKESSSRSSSRNRSNNRRNYNRRNSKDRALERLEKWVPKTKLGKLVKQGKIVSVSQVLESGERIMEAEIVDKLLPNLESEFINIGQLKGKFGGGKRRIFKQTQKKTKEGSKPIFSVMAVVGNKDGYVGLGVGRSEETLPAKEKAIRNAKLNLIQISRGCGSWECGCGNPHSIPFEVSARDGSVRLTLLPAPKGIGLSIEDDLKKILSLAGIRDIWTKVKGQSKTKMNLANTCFKALIKLSEVKVRDADIKKVVYGELK